MAYVAISESLTQQVEGVINRMASSELAATFGADGAKWPQLAVTPTDPLIDFFWRDAPHLRGVVPEEWLQQVSQIDVHVRYGDKDGCDVCNRYRLTEAVYIPKCFDHYAPDVRDTSKDTRFDAVRAELNARADVSRRWDKVKEQVIGFLKECKSLNEAVKLYPDIVHYIPPAILNKLNEQKVRAAKEVSKAATKLSELDTVALSAAPVLARITGHK